MPGETWANKKPDRVGVKCCRGDSPLTQTGAAVLLEKICGEPTGDSKKERSKGECSATH